MQVFLFKDRGITADFAARAAVSGYRALVLTGDIRLPPVVIATPATA